MRIRPLFALAALALVAGPAAAADADVKAVIDKAVKAHGGEEKLAKYKALRLKAKGTIYQMGTEIEFTLEGSAQYPDQLRNEIKLEIMGNGITIVQVYNGKKGWVQGMDQTMELDGDELQESKDQAYGTYLESILPLAKDKQLTVTAIGEEKVEGKAAVGLKVAAKGFKDVKMYFDKESGLLVKTASKSKEMGQDVNSESFYRDYKDVSGVKQAMKQSVKHDGKKYLEAELTEVKMLEKLDASTFDKP